AQRIQHPLQVQRRDGVVADHEGVAPAQRAREQATVAKQVRADRDGIGTIAADGDLAAVLVHAMVVSWMPDCGMRFHCACSSRASCAVAWGGKRWSVSKHRSATST